MNDFTVNKEKCFSSSFSIFGTEMEKLIRLNSGDQAPHPVQRVLQNYIHGRFQPPLNSYYLPSFNPATNSMETLVPQSCHEDVNLAVQSAQSAFLTWSETPKGIRADWMNRIAQGIQDRLLDFALAESQDQGKPVELAKSVE